MKSIKLYFVTLIIINRKYRFYEIRYLLEGFGGIEVKGPVKLGQDVGDFRGKPEQESLVTVHLQKHS